MPKSEKQKIKTLYVAKFFLENSDENHAVTANDILDYLKEECSIEAERRSIYRDIAILRDEFGMDIDGGAGGKYRLMSRQFDQNDLRILAECVHAAKFISASKAKELVETIMRLVPLQCIFNATIVSTSFSNTMCFLALFRYFAPYYSVNVIILPQIFHVPLKYKKGTSRTISLREVPF